MIIVSGLFAKTVKVDCNNRRYAIYIPVGALAMLHAMMNNGEVEVLAVMVSSTCPGSAACVDAINTYYGRTDLPIGVKKGRGVNRDVGYVSKVACKYPQDIKSGENAADAKLLYRQILAGLPDKSVKIINVGLMPFS